MPHRSCPNKIVRNPTLRFYSETTSNSKSFIFLGEKRCGKTSLIQKFFDENPKEDLPETTALDFKYTVKSKDERKVTVNVYELGGGRIISNMLSTCLTEESILDTTVCICVDLSKPGNSVDSVLFWLNVIREQIQVIAEKLQKSNPEKFALLQ